MIITLNFFAKNTNLFKVKVKVKGLRDIRIHEPLYDEEAVFLVM